jgi:hypothetical protein
MSPTMAPFHHLVHSLSRSNRLHLVLEKDKGTIWALCMLWLKRRDVGTSLSRINHLCKQCIRSSALLSDSLHELERLAPSLFLADPMFLEALDSTASELASTYHAAVGRGSLEDLSLLQQQALTSELIRRTLGKYRDDDLAELLQRLTGASSREVTGAQIQNCRVEVNRSPEQRDLLAARILAVTITAVPRDS